MYDDIADIYLEIFPFNQGFLSFLRKYLSGSESAVLDLGCGPGDYVDALSRAGYRAVGIDSSAGMVEQAQMQKQGTFHHLSFTEISQLEGGFDCACCVGNSLSYLSRNATYPFMKDIHSLLKTSGHFVLQVVNWDKLYQMRSSDFPINKISDGRTFHRRYEWIDHTQVIFHTEIRQDHEIIGSWAAPLYPKYYEELLDDLQNTGLIVTSQFGDYEESPFDPQFSPAMILAAQKV